MADQETYQVLFPISQDEQARQPKAEYLLAQDVYARIADMLKQGLRKIEKAENLDDLDQHRAHEAILLQGDRGTGKSAILVNLQLYLEKRTDFADDLLILKPIDPTLLEDGENMFLDIFIAAIVRNKEVRAKLDKGGRDAEAFYDQLCKVGNALESSQTQHEQHGMDKVRALIGSSAIADEVHQLFRCALKLTEKKLIVLPIDDVDTALQHAYEKIEIVRKYLVSPYVIPLISGDLSLYDDVIWRDIHGRLLTDSKSEGQQALDRAKKLSIDYQRKILPLPRRIDVPPLADYLQSQSVSLVNGEKILLSFPIFSSWLDAVLNERINGAENSHLQLPIHTVREFAQLISHVKSLIPQLAEKIPKKLLNINNVRRLIFMKPALEAIIADFCMEYNQVRTLENDSMRKNSLQKLYTSVQGKINSLPQTIEDGPFSVVTTWQNSLMEYFKHHHQGGAIYLTLKANVHFSNCAQQNGNIRCPIFNTDLFKPSEHNKYKQFSQSFNINKEWKIFINEKIPGIWLKDIPTSSILPFPKPELGRRIRDSRKTITEDYLPQMRELNDAELIRKLMTHYNFYNSTNRATLTLTGRIFELVITSLIRDLNITEVLDMVYRAPFFSVAEMISTKTFSIVADDEVFNHEDARDDNFASEALVHLVDEINNWRKSHVNDFATPPNSWLIYNITNKFFNQVQLFNSQKRANAVEGSLKDVFGTALQSFYSIWAIFGSFEKGPIFGFDDIIAYMNIDNAEATFTSNQLFKQNIQPFLRKITEEGSEFFDFRTGSYTYLLATHPLKNLLERIYKLISEKEKNPINEAPTKQKNSHIENTLAIKIKVDEELFRKEIYGIFHNKGWDTAKIMNEESRDEIRELVATIRRKLNKNNPSLIRYLDNPSLFPPAHLISNLGKLQLILKKIKEDDAKASNQAEN